MPKNKTHSGAKKRFRTTGSGKIMREQAGARHLLEHKSSRKTRRLATDQVLETADGRKAKKGDFRRLWIQRINAASRAQGLTYNRLIQGLNLAGVEVDRRMLAELAVSDINAFNALVKVAKDALPADVNAPKA